MKKIANNHTLKKTNIIDTNSEKFISDATNLSDKINLATKIWTEQQQLIEAADAKANFNLVICAALFTGFIVMSGLVLPIIKGEEGVYIVLLLIIGISSFISIVTSFLLALYVVLPRFSDESFSNDPKPFPYFHYIAQKVKSADNLFDEVLKSSNIDLLKIRIHQAFELANIADKKMIWARRSVIMTIISVIVTATFLVIYCLCY